MWSGRWSSRPTRCSNPVLAAAKHVWLTRREIEDVKLRVLAERGGAPGGACGHPPARLGGPTGGRGQGPLGGGLHPPSAGQVRRGCAGLGVHPYQTPRDRLPARAGATRGGVMKYVLFVCNHNAGRSQMAQAFFERHAPADVRAESAGSSPARGVADGRRGDGRGRHRHLRPQAAQAAARDAAARRLGGHDGLRRRLPVRAHHRRGLGHPRPRRAAAGDVRAIRDAIEARVRELIEHQARRHPHRPHRAPDAPGAAAARCSPRSSSGADPPEDIRACADAVLARYATARRSHVLTLAHRQTRECLRAESCDALAGGRAI